MKTEYIEVKVTPEEKLLYLKLVVNLNRDVIASWAKRFEEILNSDDVESISLQFIPSVLNHPKLEIKTVLNYKEIENGPKTNA